jgi:hypothetical protein
MAFKFDIETFVFVDFEASRTLLMAWMPPPDGISMCHYDECLSHHC